MSAEWTDWLFPRSAFGDWSSSRNYLSPGADHCRYSVLNEQSRFKVMILDVAWHRAPRNQMSNRASIDPALMAPRNAPWSSSFWSA